MNRRADCLMAEELARGARLCPRTVGAYAVALIAPLVLLTLWIPGWWAIPLGAWRPWQLIVAFCGWRILETLGKVIQFTDTISPIDPLDLKCQIERLRLRADLRAVLAEHDFEREMAAGAQKQGPP